MIDARLEYRLALDLALAALTRSDGDGNPSSPLLLVASSSAIVGEVASRVVGPVDLIADAPGVDVPTASGSVRAWTGRASAGRAGAIWAAPQPGTWRVRLAEIDGDLRPGGRLAILSGGPVGQVLARFRRAWSSGEPAWTAAALWRELTQRDYHVERTYALGGPRGAALAAGRRLALATGRAALADRCEVGYRLAITDVAPRLSQFRLTVVQKGSR